MNILNIDSSMFERGEALPAEIIEGRKTDYALYELIETSSGKLLAYELYSSSIARRSIAAGFYIEEVKQNGFKKSISFNEVEDSRKQDIREMLKRRGYKEPIDFQ